jgi:hypothetical protein
MWGNSGVLPPFPHDIPRQQCLAPVLPQPCWSIAVTHTSTMMTMSLGDEAPWIYLSRKSLS